jgi:hypothetical protein
MLANETLELGDEPGVMTEREVRVQALLESGETDLFQPADFRLGERLAGEVCERRPAPKSKSIPQELRRLVRRRLFCLGHLLLEAEQIELVRLNPDQISRFASDDGFGAPEQLAELGNVVLERVGRRSWRASPPERIDEGVD